MLFPVRCAGCRTPGTALCKTCASSIPLSKDLENGMYAVFGYEHPIVRRAVWELKYHRHSEAAHALAHAAVPYLVEELSEYLQSAHHENIVLVPIPTHRTRARDRGFNQSALLATWWKDALPRAQIRECLEKTTKTLPQARLSRSARLRNLAGSMRASKTLDHRTIYLVVDDVITTGATVAEARRALRAAGARKIYSCALAHGYVRA